MRASDRLRAQRERLNLEPEEVAAAAQITPNAYRDLEDHEHDLYMTVSLREIANICKSLRIESTDLFTEAESSVYTKAIDDLAVQVQAHLNSSKLSKEQFERNVGWKLGTFPAQLNSYWDWNVDCLKDICEAVGANWKEYLPSRRSAETGTGVESER
jgi:transcriptional regulator with XRE-family HTH domain